MDPDPRLAGGAHGRADWEKAAADVLRRSGRMRPEDPDSLVWRTLARTTLEGIEVPALGVPDDLEGLPGTGVPGSAPYTRGTAPVGEGWDVRAHLADPDPGQAAADALLDLRNGVTSLWLSLGRGGIAVEHLPQVLGEVHLDRAAVVLDCPRDPPAAAEALCALLVERSVRPAGGTVLAVDPVSAFLRGHPPEGDSAAVVCHLAALALDHGALACTVDATAVHDLGASDAQELGYALAVGADLLRVLTTTAGLTVEEAAGLLEFRFAATDEQFLTIAKLRAARRLWHRVLELSGAPGAAGQRQHAVTSRPMLTRYDPWVNMLRSTVAAFAAGTGGATSVTVLPFDTALGLPDALARRNARNTSSLLVHEAHAARVADPAGGSYAVERLTGDLAAVGWAELQQVESEGGILSSVSAPEAGLLDRVRQQAALRRREVATRRRPITGVTEFPDLDERLPERRPHPEDAPVVDRYGGAFEALRDDPPATPVLLATMGTVAEHTARAGFAANLLAAGGVRTVAAGPTSGVAEVLEAHRATGSPVVCLAGPDTAYAAWGPDLVQALRDAGARYVVLSGEPGAGTVPAGLVDDSCAYGSDALAFLTRLRQELPR